mmetsp:Transcript_40711/g.126684  ORF Transcript_40711/g.126684 Transcript_40711/m.126684 type:complete len:355 (+) Transcript_40711:74-1138(+)|eukprot:CAMPEP_0204587160 /NCGR_PEP_ID=MMETSP0661-20131031/47901_1 /ASSEMBLY_ACC=CAM_ASM_000606 /TAXON_ID=109239 /ORGANISM="Alexandrium margalefi, Strain AMGDE01CS-322" /LENGTH=354 /DNA_ID=CAMNT_0051596859 /DNA_START=56 /DNA_END=1120 /DNA_ORIENTATION=+
MPVNGHKLLCSAALLAVGAAIFAHQTQRQQHLSQAEPAADIPMVPLLGGGGMPMAGLGMCCGRKTAEVLDFLLAGGRLLDDANHYQNQRAVREALRQAAAAGVPREEVFLESRFAGKDNGYDSAIREIETLLREYDVAYLDLAMTAEPSSASREEHARCGDDRKCRQETWRGLSELKRRGLVKHIGVANFGPRQLQDILDLGGEPVEVNEIEFHPWAFKENFETVEWCHRHGIAVIAYGSLLNGATAQMTLPWQNKSLEKMMQARAFDGVNAIADAHNKTSHQVLLRWAIEHNVTVIPGSSKVEHMKSNMNIFDFKLSPEEVRRLETVPDKDRLAIFPWNLPDRERYMWAGPPS